jgi:hypothetical protein
MNRKELPPTGGSNQLTVKRKATMSMNKKQKLQMAVNLLALFAKAKWEEKSGGLYAIVGDTEVGRRHRY